MKKILLLSALAVAGLGASAQGVSFTDCFKVVYDGQEVANGATIASQHLNEDTQQYHADIMMYLASDSPAAVSYTASYGTDPTYETANADRLGWGSPELCFELKDPLGSQSNCMPGPMGTPSIFSQMVNPIGLSTTDEAQSYVEWQFHLSGTMDIANRKIVPASKTGTYTIAFKGYADAAKDGSGKWSGDETDEFVIYVNIGPDAKADGVASIAADADAPREYFDFTGCRVLNPAQGQMVIYRQGSKAGKMVVR